MPTVYREHGLRFIVFTDYHPPAHVHVEGRGTAKVALVPQVAILYDRGLSKADARRILDVVEEQRDAMLEAWNRIHE